jgi:hypothetical protein
MSSLLQSARWTKVFLAAVVLLAIAQSAAGDAAGLFASEDWGAGPQGSLAGDPSDASILGDEPFLAAAPSTPRLTARLGAVILQRARPASEYLVFNPVTGASLLDPYDLVFPFRGGVDAGLVWRGTMADVEFRYFGVEQATATLGPVFSADGIALNVPDDDPLLEPISAKMTGASSLQSFELNVRRNVSPRFTWLAGLRYISFRDAMGLVAGDPTLTNYGSVMFGAQNNLYGLQIGADAILWDNGRRFRVESAIKAGVYANGASTSLDGRSTDPNDEAFSFRFGRDRTSFVGDLSVTGVYQLNRWWAIRAGYQFLWLSSVAVGSMQFHNFDAGLVPNTSATVMFHGALVGLERSW